MRVAGAAGLRAGWQMAGCRLWDGPEMGSVMGVRRWASGSVTGRGHVGWAGHERCTHVPSKPG